MSIYRYILFPSLLFSIIFGTNNYLWPTNASNSITTVFGDIRPFRYHTGIDIRTYGINGLDIYAIEDGHISRIAVSASGYGKVVYIKMNDGNTSIYAHLDRFNEKLELVKEQLQRKCDCFSIDHTFSENQYPIKRGDIIGYTGDSGSLSGPHIHFEIRNRKGEPFNPLLTNYTLKDNISPVPEKLIITNLDKTSHINGLPKIAEFEIEKISDTDYVVNNIISVSGEIGISLEIYDKMDEQPFNFGLYNIKLEIDNDIIFQAEYNHINFNEGFKVYSERDYSKYNFERKKIYSLYKKNNYKPSSFIQNIPIKKISFEDRSYHKCKITASDYNGNQIQVNFDLLSTKNKNTIIDITNKQNGFLVESNDEKLKSINIYLINELDEKIIFNDLRIDTLSSTSYFVQNSKVLLNTLALEPIYKDGGRGPIQYHKIKFDDTVLRGKIKLIDNERGTSFEFEENFFSNKQPVLGLTLDGKLYRYPLYKSSIRGYISQMFYPLELRGLTKASIFYLDSTIHQFSTDINSNVSISGFPLILNDKLITLKSVNNQKIYSSFDESNHDDSFLYIQSYPDKNLIDEMDIIYGPFLIGPQSVPLKNEFELFYENQENYANLGIFKYDDYNKKWKFSDNEKEGTKIKTKIKTGGIYSIIKDNQPPIISKKIPNVGSTYRHDHFSMLQYEIKDDLCGIKNENSIEVLLDEKKIIVEYNTYRNMVFHKLKEPLNLGTHTIEVMVRDNCNNINKIKGNFYIK